MSSRRRRRPAGSIDWSTPRPWRARSYQCRARARALNWYEPIVRTIAHVLRRALHVRDVARTIEPFLLVSALPTISVSVVLAVIWGGRSLWLIPLGFLTGALVSCLVVFLAVVLMGIV